jgi:hypothetical protein
MHRGTLPHAIHRHLDIRILDQRKRPCQFWMALDFGKLFSSRSWFESLGPRHVLVAHSGPPAKCPPRPQNFTTYPIRHSHLRISIIAMAMHAGYRLGVTVDNVLICASTLYRSERRHTVGPRQRYRGCCSAWGSLVFALLTAVVSRLRSYGFKIPYQWEIDRS